ncbi:unnamed protein product [Ectocarpus sp. 13 AM-2016]
MAPATTTASPSRPFSSKSSFLCARRKSRSASCSCSFSRVSERRPSSSAGGQRQPAPRRRPAFARAPPPPPPPPRLTSALETSTATATAVVTFGYRPPLQLLLLLLLPEAAVAARGSAWRRRTLLPRHSVTAAAGVSAMTAVSWTPGGRTPTTEGLPRRHRSRPPRAVAGPVGFPPPPAAYPRRRGPATCGA